MATDATGTPTTLGIPKYNTSNDAPSGLGFTAAMDAIDALIQGRIAKPAGIAAGEVPVWDGSTFVRSSVTRVGPASLGSGTPDGTKFLAGDGAWKTVSPTTYRKSTQKDVTNTTTAIDLFNGEITIAAGALGATGILRIKAWGDFLENAAGNFDWQLVAGGTVLVASAASNLALGAARRAWSIEAYIANTGTVATNDVYGELRIGSFSVPTTGVGGGVFSAGVSDSISNTGLTVDFSTAKLLELKAHWAAASPSLSWRLNGALVEVL